MRRLFAILTVLWVSLFASPQVVHAGTHTYDTSSIERVGEQHVNTAEAVAALCSEVREGPASPSEASRGGCTTPSATFIATNTSREANFVQRQQAMLDADVGYNVSPESTFAQYPHVGRSGTFVTDGRAVADAIGHSGGSARYSVGLTTNVSRGRISYFRAWRAERALGLERGSLKGGFRVTEVQGIAGMSPRSPLTGNPYFQGGGQGLPGGGPEVVVDPIPTSPWP